MTPAEAEALFLMACRFDVLALKPGNVSIARAGHGMCAKDFLLSARVAAPRVVRHRQSLGTSVRRAMADTLQAVGCNTNLGIVLLSVPLLHAALRPGNESLERGVTQVLAATTVRDTVEVYRAIRLTNPAGLGRVPRADVAEVPRISLGDAMRLAARRDRIALQYANGFRDVFKTGVTALWRELASGASLSDAVTACFMAFLASYPDTHIARKWGRSSALETRQEAQSVTSALKACDTRRERKAILTAFDAALKRRGHNPGTSADLTVASLLALLLDSARADRAGSGHSARQEQHSQVSVRGVSNGCCGSRTGRRISRGRRQ